MIHTIVCEPTEPAHKKLPAWKLVSYYDDAKDRVFLPAAVFGASEMEVLMCASFDGAPMIEEKGHLYVESGWALREFPKHADEIRPIIERIRSAGKEQP